MADDSDNEHKVTIDEKEAKKQFFEELKNKNLEEKKKLEETKKLEENNKSEDNTKLEDNTKQEKNKDDNKTEVKQPEIKDIPKEQEKVEENDLKKDDFSKKDEEDIEEKKSGFFNKRLKASIIDTIVTGVISIAVVYIIDLILRLAAGYYIVDIKGMFIIVFIIVLVLYPFVMNKTKYKVTIGEKFSK